MRAVRCDLRSSRSSAPDGSDAEPGLDQLDQVVRGVTQYVKNQLTDDGVQENVFENVFNFLQPDLAMSDPAPKFDNPSTNRKAGVSNNC